MKKIILILMVIYSSFGFDIDDFDKGVLYLNNGNFKDAYDIFYEGCELNDEMSCNELGFMYINKQVTKEIDNTANDKDNIKIGISYIFKSCELGNINACSDIIDLKNRFKIDDEVYNKSNKKYEELEQQYLIQDDLNATNY
ncbi:hypothetical protein [Campylobacter pinnipediorum]|uniref:hypothetical protein n=1 Tax=Campylobacter pinnipediorum TaxID=1965231 RepID=UPI000995CF1E|nr:hypothetical protein [Campylobacter pinnipediorum]AQW82527.1 hypothetical protein CPIN17261_0505 [Campylobacter pinnipediorum subsp. pinnipediorum]